MRDIQGYEGLYAVTEDGRVWSYYSNKFLSPGKNTYGYLQVRLYKNGNSSLHLVHRLVASAFIPNPDNLEQVNHKDEDKTRNWVDNLEWVTAKENSNYGTRTARSAKKRSRVVYCVELNRTFESTRAAERELRVGHHISECCKNQQKTCGGYHWKYIEE